MIELVPWPVLGVFAIAAVALVVTPGPDMMLMAARSVAHGARAGFIASLGSLVGMCLHGLLAGYGLGALVAEAPGLYDGLRWLGAAYLMWLAVEAWRARGVFTPGAADDRRNTLALLAQGLLTNLTNPKAVLFFLALFPQFIDPARGPMVAQALILVGLILVPSLLFNLAMCLLAARVRHHLIGDTRFARWTNRLLAAVFGGIALRLVVESR